MKKLFDETKYTKYYIDKEGKIYTTTKYLKSRRGKGLTEVKPNINRQRGYLYARTRNRNWQIHRLVGEFFVPNPHDKKYINHKDGNKHNNKYTNLEWATAKENAQHAIRAGLTRQIEKNGGGNLKYTNEQIKEVYDRVKSGMTYVKAGEIHEMPYSTVAHLMRGSRRKII